MNKTELSVLVLLVLVLGILLFRERSVALDAQAALAASTAERDALRSRVAVLESEHISAAGKTGGLAAPGVATGFTTREAPGDAVFRGPIEKVGMPGPMAALDSPEMRRLMALQQRGRLDGRYAALFKSLKLPPAQLEQLKQLLVDKQNTPMDVMAAARKQSLGAGDGGEIHDLIQQENASVDSAIRQLLGDAGYEQYRNYEQTQSQRSVVDQLASRLSYGDAPLTPEQSQDLLALLAASSPTSLGSDVRTDGGPVQFATVSVGPNADTTYKFSASNTPVVSDAALESAQEFLSPEQISALREIQAEQQAQQQMGELLRQSLPPPGKGAFFISAPAVRTGGG